MSLMSMRRKMASKRTATYILWILIAVFLLGVLLWSVPSGSRGGKQTGESTVEGGKNAIALVGKDKVTLEAMEDAYALWRNGEGNGASFEEIITQRRRIFASLVEQSLAKQEMKNLGIRDRTSLYRKYAREEAQSTFNQIREITKSQAESLKASAKTDEEKKKVKSADELLSDWLGYYMGQVGPNTAKVTEKDFLRWYVNEKLLNRETPNEEFLKNARLRVIGAKFIAGLPVNPLSEEFVKKLNTQEVKARWIFIAAKGKTADAQAEARKKAETVRAEIIKAPDSFAEKAKAASSHISALDGGDLQWVQGGGTNPFLPIRAEYLAFATKPGEISPVMQCMNFTFTGIESGYGFLLAEQVRAREKMPKEGYNWDKERNEAIRAATQRFESGFGQEAIDLLRNQLTIRGVTPEPASYLAEIEGRFSEAEVDALKMKVVTGSANERSSSEEVRAAFAFELAGKATDAKQRIQLFLEALKGAGASLGQVRLELGRAYISDGQKALGLEQFAMAEIAGKESDTKLREDLKAEYEKLNDKDGVKRMKEWLDSRQSPAPSVTR